MFCSRSFLPEKSGKNNIFSSKKKIFSVTVYFFRKLMAKKIKNYYGKTKYLL